MENKIKTLIESLTEITKFRTQHQFIDGYSTKYINTSTYGRIINDYDIVIYFYYTKNISIAIENFCIENNLTYIIYRAREYFDYRGIPSRLYMLKIKKL